MCACKGCKKQVGGCVEDAAHLLVDNAVSAADGTRMAFTSSEVVCVVSTLLHKSACCTVLCRTRPLCMTALVVAWLCHAVSIHVDWEEALRSRHIKAKLWTSLNVVSQLLASLAVRSYSM